MTWIGERGSELDKLKVGLKVGLITIISDPVVSISAS